MTLLLEIFVEESETPNSVSRNVAHYHLTHMEISTFNRHSLKPRPTLPSPLNPPTSTPAHTLHTHARARARTHTRTRARAHSHTHTHTHTPTHTHSAIIRCSCSWCRSVIVFLFCPHVLFLSLFISVLMDDDCPRDVFIDRTSACNQL